MDLYRITKTDPRNHASEVRYGTLARVRAMERAAREANDSRDHTKAWIDSHPERYRDHDPGPHWWQHVTLKIERAIIVEFEDVTSEFAGS